MLDKFNPTLLKKEQKFFFNSKLFKYLGRVNDSTFLVQNDLNQIKLKPLSWFTGKNFLPYRLESNYNTSTPVKHIKTNLILNNEN